MMKTWNFKIWCPSRDDVLYRGSVQAETAEEAKVEVRLAYDAAGRGVTVWRNGFTDKTK